MGKPLELPVPDGLGCDDVYERAIGAGFGERQVGKQKGGSLERFLFLKYVVAGKCLAWKNILDMRRAVDYLLR